MIELKQWTTYDARAAVEGFDGIEHTEGELAEAWQHLIDTGACWSLQGWYGRSLRTRRRMNAARYGP